MALFIHTSLMKDYKKLVKNIDSIRKSSELETYWDADSDKKCTLKSWLIATSDPSVSYVYPWINERDSDFNTLNKMIKDMRLVKATNVKDLPLLINHVEEPAKTLLVRRMKNANRKKDVGSD